MAYSKDWTDPNKAGPYLRDDEVNRETSRLLNNPPQVVPLKTRPAQINADVIIILRDLLAAAEKGEIIGLAVASVEASGSTRVDVAQNECFPALLGAVMLVQHRMCARHVGDDI